jgi:hypothetical protein
MDWFKFLPKNIEWKIQHNRIYYRKMAWIPFAYINSSKMVCLYLEPKSSKLILKVTKELMKTKCKFFFISPMLDDPHIQRNTDNIPRLNIENYLKNYAIPVFFDGFDKIGFDIIENLILYCKSTNSFELIKEVLQSVNNEVQSKYFDYYSKKDIYNTKREDIRERFNNLWRDIQIQNLLK